MEIPDFVKEVFNDGQLVVTRVGLWHHLRDLESGDGKWVWVGPDKQQLAKAFRYPVREVSLNNPQE